MIVILIGLITVAIFLVLITFRAFSLSGNKKLKEAMKLENQGKYHEALVVYDYLLNSGYSPSEIRWKIANTSLKAGIIPRALKELNVIMETKELPENVSEVAIKSLIAECSLKMGRIKEAFVEYFELASMMPDNLMVIYELGKLYAGQKKTAKAIQLFEKCFKLSPNDHELCYTLAKAYMDYGDAEKATEALERVLRFKFYDNGRVDYFLGVLYFSAKKYDLALQHLLQVLKLRPRDNRMMSECHHLIALCYKEKGLIDEAFTNFEKSQTYSELLPEEGSGKKTLYNQGVLLYKSGHYKEALEKFYKLKVLDFKYKDVDQVIKTIAQKLRNGEAMDRNFTNYISENPLLNVLKRGFLYSKTQFNIDAIEAEAEKQVGNIGPKVKSMPYNTIDEVNSMSSRDFKDLARKLVKGSGFNIKSEPRFAGDNEYIDGDAINFLATPSQNFKSNQSVLITVRRYKEEVPELSVSRFLDWVDENGISGLFIASANFSSQAMRMIHSNSNIKFIDRNGLSRMLGRLR